MSANEPLLPMDLPETPASPKLGTDKVEIVWTSDVSDCDTCGPSYSDGAIVYINGVQVLDLMPIASCFDGQHYEEAAVFRKIIPFLDAYLVERHEND